MTFKIARPKNCTHWQGRQDYSHLHLSKATLTFLATETCRGRHHMLYSIKLTYETGGKINEIETARRNPHSPAEVTPNPPGTATPNGVSC